ncbi:hypothetical protein [Pedosphaera parvula]|uniref:Uncharacterized protein n=1 Tax=Pedosphaera parvula (strain Ellin514) TaxID=320771 RepID=B9XHT7_PEDPL|nr:hypothetical protein [Pedosphaera parvula]EEF60665.1 hypothetical protein Cflav_PD6256 [Pedosphaera parvula Ellin514]
MKHITIILLLLAAASLEALADGIPFRSFRTSRVSVPATVLALTKEQMSSLTTSNRFITLTADQRTRLQRDVSFVPERLEVYPLEWAQDTCTCEILNLGIRYTKTKIEVPHGLLGRTLQDRKFWQR